MVVVELIYNLAILIAFSVFSGFIDLRFKRSEIPGKVFQGILFGAVSVIGMLYPFYLIEGIIFDGRSIVISLCTLFFGPLSGSISALIAASFRLSLGGGGVTMGILVIFTSFIIGYYFHKNSAKFLRKRSENTYFYLMGLTVHAVMLLLMFFLPFAQFSNAFQTLSFSILVVYPIVTLLIGKILSDQQHNQSFMDEISRSEQMLRSTLYSIGDGVITTNRTGIVKQMNPVAEKMTGWSEVEAKGQMIDIIFNLINAETRLRIENPVLTVLHENKVIGLSENCMLISREGNEIFTANSAAPIINEKGKLTGAVLVFRNQTSEKLMTNLLKESERQITSLMGNLPGLVFRCKNDFDRTMIFVSEGCFTLTGYQQEDFLTINSTTFCQIIHPEDRNFIFNEIQSALIQKIPFQITYRIHSHGGSEKWVWEQGVGIYDRMGDLLFLEGFISDITERKRIEGNLRYYNDRLKLISSIAKELIGKLPIEMMVNKMLKEIILAFKVDSGLIRILKDEGLVLLTKHNVPDYSIVEVLPPDVGIPGKMIETREPVAVLNTFQDALTKDHKSKFENEFKFISYAGAPLFVQDKIIGVLGLYSIAIQKEFTNEDLNHLQISANQIAIAIENNNLFMEIDSRKSELEKQVNIRKQIEANLRESESSLNLIIDSTNIVLYRLSYTDFKYEYMNPAITRIIGYTPEEINLLGFKRLVVKIESMSGINLNPDEIKSNNSHYKHEYSADYLIRKKDGDLCWLSDQSFPWFDENGSVKGSTGVLSDITERKNTEREMSEQRYKFEQLFENSPVAIALLDNQINIMSINNSFSQLFGYSVEQIRGKNIDELLASPNLIKEAREISDRISHKGAETIETFRRKSDGSDVFVKIAGVPVVLEGKTIAIYGMYVDLTERKKGEDEIRIAKDKAEEMSKLKSSLLANMSHELRTPLIGILGFSEILQEEAQDDSTKSMAEMINKGGKRLLETLNMILDMSRVEAGKIEIEKEMLDITMITDDVIRLFSKSAAKKGLYIKTDYDKNLPKISLDRKLTSQILNNLINNAIKFTRTGGLTISVKKNEPKLVIIVHDTGIGISQNDQKIIWEEFRQASEGFGRVYEGTGLGLSITRRFVQKLDGTIRVESKPNEGTSFIIEFPLQS